MSQQRARRQWRARVGSTCAPFQRATLKTQVPLWRPPYAFSRAADPHRSLPAHRGSASRFHRPSTCPLSTHIGHTPFPELSTRGGRSIQQALRRSYKLGWPQRRRVGWAAGGATCPRISSVLIAACWLPDAAIHPSRRWCIRGGRCWRPPRQHHGRWAPSRRRLPSG